MNKNTDITSPSNHGLQRQIDSLENEVVSLTDKNKNLNDEITRIKNELRQIKDLLNRAGIEKLTPENFKGEENFKRVMTPGGFDLLDRI